MDIKADTAARPAIRIRGARQNNLRDIDLDIPLGTFAVVTGLSGSGKSSLVFDTLYAEGQRRYVETFSPYARQFLDRMDRPNVRSIEGVPPAIAIDQNAVIRTSRSTVGTMTEINDRLKLLFVHSAALYCPHDGSPVEDFTPERIWADICRRLAAAGLEDARAAIAFERRVPRAIPIEEAEAALSAQGFTHILARRDEPQAVVLTIAADRFRAGRIERARAMDAIATALGKGDGELIFLTQADAESGWKPLGRWRLGRVCPECGESFREPRPSDFSFNSAAGACPECHGFGRIPAIDMNLVIPDRTRTLEEDAVKPFSTEAYQECKADMLRACRAHGIPEDRPYDELSASARRFIEEGDPEWTGDWKHEWYGIRRFFDWLETRSYKMAVRVLIARYRCYRTCPVCEGSRLLPQALFWRVGTREDREAARAQLGRALPLARPRIKDSLSDEAADALPGFNFHELMCLPADELLAFLRRLSERPHDEAAGLVLGEALARTGYLCDVGLGYLTLSRQSRTLSGGEVQRVNLTTALGTNLVNTLFILDEPSIGLHPRDMNRVNAIMQKLKRAGNTLVVVEHDPQVMLAGDRLIDIGPAAGAGGGQIIFDGTPREALAASTETAAYLSGRKRIARLRLPVEPGGRSFTLSNACLNNLRSVSAKFPVGRFIAVAGVSGSGKSSLITETLAPLLAKRAGLTAALSSEDINEGGIASARLSGHIPHSVELIDQASLGRTARGNPASYSGIFTPIRSLFAASRAAVAARLEPGDFSFNSGDGRCPVCSGTGLEHIEMQFLSDIWLPCPACGGKRWQEHILKIRVRLADGIERNIHEVLGLTVEEGLTAFKDRREIAGPLQILSMTGLGYLQLGQSLSTLSGGERQRLKLAARIIEGITSKTACECVFIFDEPTTGLHFLDIDRLVRLLDQLTRLGSTVIVIEHNLDILNCADWVIELGPEGGKNGGQIVFAGTPDAMIAAGTLTGKALGEWRLAQHGHLHEGFFSLAERCGPADPASAAREAHAIVVEDANEHNLRHLSVDIPRNAFSVVTGPSGSGKSTLAFDIVFAEGQRRYLESLNAYARSMVQPPPQPDVKSVRGIPPTVAIEQRTTLGGMRSTVATMTEIYHFLRLLYVKLGLPRCPNCGTEVTEQTPEIIAERMLRKFPGIPLKGFVTVIDSRKGAFRRQLLKLQKSGITLVCIDGKFVSIAEEIPELPLRKLHTIEAAVFTVSPEDSAADIARSIQSAAGLYGAPGVHVVRSDRAVPGGRTAPKLESGDHAFYSFRRACPECGMSIPDPDSRFFSYNSEKGACPVCSGYGVLTDAIRKAVASGEGLSSELRLSEGDAETVCPECGGTRLNPIARNVAWMGRTLPQVCAMTVSEARAWLASLDLDSRSQAIAGDAIAEIQSRLAFLEEVGLSYLTLDRSAPTLSGGEMQRIHLASQLGTNLQGVCYVLDEPTIGLHPRDNAMLLSVIRKLTDKGNTLLVVEHDEETIRAADQVIDIGPGAGTRGGRLVAQGTAEDIAAAPESLTGQLLLHPIPYDGVPRRPTDFSDPKLECLTLRGVSARNLRIPEIRIPLRRLTVVTGVSGSGKSTFCREVLFKSLERHIADPASVPAGAASIEGADAVGRVLEVDQSPIGRTSRSCPATYIDIMTAIRRLYEETNEAKARGYTASRFTFNRREGWCPECEGLGTRTVAMSFLPDVRVVCEGCGGKRYSQETLDVLWRGKSIGDVLAMEVDEAAEFFASMPSIARPLRLMQDVGLGYLTLGQPSSTLSGGEAQRIKLVAELSRVRLEGDLPQRAPHTLYVLDEPTVGLHMSDVRRLAEVLSRLADAGCTVVVIEHSLDIAAGADWIIDLGPEGGDRGGRISAEGTPAEVAQADTPTGRALRKFLAQHAPGGR